MLYYIDKPMAEQPYVLIVDDEESFREIFAAKLSAAGYKIDTAENGQAGLDKMAQQKPDLVLMDVKMPVMDGATAVLKMRENPDLKGVRVAFLTSLGDPRLEMREINEKFSSEIGAQAYLKKTDDLDTIAEAVKRLLA